MQQQDLERQYAGSQAEYSRGFLRRRYQDMILEQDIREAAEAYFQEFDAEEIPANRIELMQYPEQDERLIYQN